MSAKGGSSNAPSEPPIQGGHDALPSPALRRNPRRRSAATTKPDALPRSSKRARTSPASPHHKPDARRPEPHQRSPSPGPDARSPAPTPDAPARHHTTPPSAPPSAPASSSSSAPQAAVTKEAPPPPPTCSILPTPSTHVFARYLRYLEPPTFTHLAVSPKCHYIYLPSQLKRSGSPIPIPSANNNQGPNHDDAILLWDRQKEYTFPATGTILRVSVNKVSDAYTDYRLEFIYPVGEPRRADALNREGYVVSCTHHRASVQPLCAVTGATWLSLPLYPSNEEEEEEEGGFVYYYLYFETPTVPTTKSFPGACGEPNGTRGGSRFARDLLRKFAGGENAQFQLSKVIKTMRARNLTVAELVGGCDIKLPARLQTKS